MSCIWFGVLYRLSSIVDGSSTVVELSGYTVSYRREGLFFSLCIQRPLLKTKDMNVPGRFRREAVYGPFENTMFSGDQHHLAPVVFLAT